MKICLDPGHGGYDPGAVNKSDGTKEKDINLIVATELKAELETRGITVVMTRTSDNSPGGIKILNAELQKRCDICNASKADLFLSLHVNAGGGVGAEAYVWPGGQSSTIAASLMTALSPVMGVHGEAIKDGGPNGRNYKVICDTDPPAVLLELGFIDSSDLTKLKANLHNFAGILAGPLGKFLGGKVPPSIPDRVVTKPELEQAINSLRAEMTALIRK